MTDILQRLTRDIAAGLVPEEVRENLTSFYHSYCSALELDGKFTAKIAESLNAFHDAVLESLAHPYTFSHYHAAERAPFDYYEMGMNLFRPLIKFQESILLGTKNLETICEQLAKNENVIFLANHQSEPDPQAISLMLEEPFPTIAESISFIAGHRVTSDPLAIPMSRGRNLFCVFSKRHIENPPEKKQERLRHNQTTMRIMGEKLSEGGLCIYVAPSGGRDRAGPDGRLAPAPFDAKSIEMLRLTALKASTPTHFYPMSLVTYDLLPPPDTILTELGESRQTMRTPIHIAIGNEIDMDGITTTQDKQLAREHRAEAIWNLVNQGYQQLLKECL